MSENHSSPFQPEITHPMKITKAQFHVPHLEELIDLLDEVVRQQAGGNVADTSKRIRELAIERRAGMPGAEERLIEELDRLDTNAACDVIRGLTIYFDLANLSEDLNRIRTLQGRSRFADSKAKKRNETLFDAIGTIKDRGLSASETQALISQLRIEFVFTAHPSEAKRRTSRRMLRRLRGTLMEMTQPQVSADVRPRLERKIRADITAMWQSDLLRPKRPGVLSEVERGLFFAKNLWKAVPEISRDLLEALSDHFPDTKFELPAFIRFGTWIGGDRDGHPFVTTEITKQALAALRSTALKSHLHQCHELMDVVVTSERHVEGLDPLRAAITNATETIPELTKVISKVSETEIGRRWLKIIEFRLLATRDENAAVRYNSTSELVDDLSLLVRVLSENNGHDIVEAYVQPWLDNVRCFGFHFAAMDIRQHSGVHKQVIDHLLSANGITNYESADEAQRREILIQNLSISKPATPELPDEITAETLALFRMMVSQVQQNGLSTFGGYVISMTHDVSDVLAVLWLWHFAWSESGSVEDPPPLPVVPLFETIDDLKRSASIMEQLWAIPAYRQYLDRSEGREQMVMIGYSDSTKDGGYLAASWMLHQAQKELGELAHRQGVRLMIFHGRGGALGRGGGPAARAVLSLPPCSVNGSMRVTEQGEILAERYDDPEIAFRHLEQVTWATLLVSSDTDGQSTADYQTVIDEMATRSFNAYRGLITHPQFLSYYESATPVAEVESLPIGSRPSRRGQRRSIGDLRAIPWTFAWTQSRQLVPAWYGIGTAIRGLIDEQNGDWNLLRAMYDDWPFFSETIDNAELALAKADIEIAHRYSELCEDPKDVAVWELIREEYSRTRAAILMLKRQDELLERTDWLQHSIRARNPSVDPLNLLQIRLLRETRDADFDAEVPADISEMPEELVLRLTIHGIAAGLRTTG